MFAGRASKPAAPTAAEIAKASADINTWFDAEYEQELQMSPISLTVQGRKDKYGELDEMSEAAQDKHLAWRRASVAEMKEKFDPNKLNEEAHTSFDVWAQALDEEKGAQVPPCAVHLRQGRAAGFPAADFMNFHTVEEKSDMEAYVSRLTEVNRAMGQILDQAPSWRRRKAIMPRASPMTWRFGKRRTSSPARRLAPARTRRCGPTRKPRSRRWSRRQGDSGRRQGAEDGRRESAEREREAGL